MTADLISYPTAAGRTIDAWRRGSLVMVHSTDVAGDSWGRVCRVTAVIGEGHAQHVVVRNDAGARGTLRPWNLSHASN